ncbi:hypothetical protein CRG98_004082 [Punica granatum]|uniref:Uncharacterized protein n=1 Tax=Punica granatum TaxID=22663 RepID=A0A2I0L5Z8_PUNGR|nr:hypothetical protein CRG98_004082 [Punica granatum]
MATTASVKWSKACHNHTGEVTGILPMRGHWQPEDATDLAGVVVARGHATTTPSLIDLVICFSRA